MISTGLAGAKIVYLSLPDHKLAMAYPGFEAIHPADLPTEATLLIGYQDAFQERSGFQSAIDASPPPERSIAR
jgi:hypothetical protein